MKARTPEAKTAYRRALDRVRRHRGGPRAPVPSVPQHAVMRVAEALRKRSSIPCSRYGTGGGRYLAELTPDSVPKRSTASGAAGTPRAPARKHGVKAPIQRFRRLDLADAQVLVRRGPRDTRNAEGIEQIYWIPPEILVACVKTAEIEDLCRQGTIRPVWSRTAGRLVHRGDSVVG